VLGGQLHARELCALEAIAAELPGASVPRVPAGGMYLWVRLPDHVDDEAVARAAADEGVLVVPGARFFPVEPPAPRSGPGQAGLRAAPPRR
jgi:DNA-binding transcriptional MocR family regulator